MADITVKSEFLREVTSLIADSQVEMKKAAEEKTKLAEKAPSVVDALIENGLLAKNLKEAKVNEFISNPTSILDALTKVAAAVKPDSLGKPVEKLSANKQKGTPESYTAFEQILMG